MQQRPGALGLVTDTQGRKKPVSYIEGAVVPPEYLVDCFSEVLAVCSKYDKQASLSMPVSAFAHSTLAQIASA